MHGAALLPMLPTVAAALAEGLDEPHAAVREELLRSVGNVSRYALSDRVELPCDALDQLCRPLLDAMSAAGDGRLPAVRAGMCAVQRAVAEAPRGALRPEAVLKLLRAVLKLLHGLELPPCEALLPLARLVELCTPALVEADVTTLLQHGVAGLHAEEPLAVRAAAEMLLRLSPLIPYNVFNYIIAATAVSLRHYALALFAMVPATVGYVFVGATLAQAAAGSTAGGSAAEALQTVLLGLGAVATILAVATLSWLAKRQLSLLDERAATAVTGADDERAADHGKR